MGARRALQQQELNRDGGYELPGCWVATMQEEVRKHACMQDQPHALVLRPHAGSALNRMHVRAGSGATPVNCHHFRTSLHFQVCPEDD